MKYYVIAGEASGDLHGAKLLKALRREDPAASFRVWGGDLMAEAGGTLVKHYRDLAFMGFVEVLRNLPAILRNIKYCKEDILAHGPDVLILVDYPGFNLRIAKWAKRQGIRVFYYISPQIWAWHRSRVHGIKAHVDRMFVILPFEADFYAQYGYAVDFVGHPLLDVVEGFRADEHPLPPFEKPIIALLPGSRRQEIHSMLAVMLAVARDFPAYQFVVAAAPGLPLSFYTELMAQLPGGDQAAIVQGRTYALLSRATAALVTSGTATLETALFDVPQLVCYKGNPLSYWLARRLIQVKYISLVNLIADAPLVKELIQHEMTAPDVHRELTQLLLPENQQALRAGYASLRQKLGQAGASQRAAALMVGYLREG